VLNAGSSSLKFALTEPEPRRHLVRGRVERIGDPGAFLVLNGRRQPLSAKDHEEALEGALRAAGIEAVDAVGHRVVHGGTITAPQRVDEALITTIRDLIPFAPLHNPANLAGILAARKRFPGVPQVAVFDTAFHQTMPEVAYRYALPASASRYRRFGFHGISHAYVAEEAARALDKPLEALRLITLHLGNGASATAVKGGKSVDTSMGYTPLEGLVMGTRAGDLDPGVVLALARELGVEGAERLLNKESGLLGLSGLSNDLRDLHRAASAGDARARLALSVYAYRIKKYVGAYLAVLGGAEGIVFTGGVGENDPWVRAQALSGLEALGIRLDPKKNAAGARFIHAPDSRVKVLVIPTDEELKIALETYRLLKGR